MNPVLAIVSMIICFILGLCVHIQVKTEVVYKPNPKYVVYKDRVKFLLHDAMMPLGVKNADAWNGALFEVERRLCEEDQDD